MLNRLKVILRIAELLAMATLLGLAAEYAFAATDISRAMGEGLVHTAKETSIDIGTAASDILRGNGLRMGYAVAKGNLIAESDLVYIGVRLLKREVDYTIDYNSGTLMFNAPVRNIETIRVDYRYLGDGTPVRNATTSGLPMLSIGGTSNKMSLAYGYQTADTASSSPVDILTYGLNTNAKLGSVTSVTGMFYVSAPEQSKRASLTADKKVKTTTAPTADQLKKDQLIIQNAETGIGSVRLKFGMQDIGQNFVGFTTMRNSKVAADDVLKMLDKEKGINRTTMGLAMPTGKNALWSLDQGKISDAAGSIVTENYGLKASGVILSFGTRDIAKKFTRFSDLREADNAQMAAEVGTKRTTKGLQLRTGSKTDKTPLWSGISQSKIACEGGNYQLTTMDFTLGKLGFQSTSQKMDTTFNRMGTLNPTDRTANALSARRHFDPNAQTNQITADDLSQTNNEAGLNRNNYGVQFTDKLGSVRYAMSNIASLAGKLKSTRMGFDSARLGFYYNKQSIDATFDRLASLQSVEKSKYGNERGMNRSERGGYLKMNIGSLSVADTLVRDTSGLAFRRQGYDFQNTRLKAKVSYLSLPKDFTRTADLIETDKPYLKSEAGFNRKDYSLNFQATKSLNMDANMLHADSTALDQYRKQQRFAIAYSPTAGPKITAYQDQYSATSEASGSLLRYTHRKFTFDNTLQLFGGLTIKSLKETKQTTTASGDPIDTGVNQLHIETDPKSRMLFTIDLNDRQLDKDNYDNLRSIAIKTMLLKDTAFKTYFSTNDRPDDQSERNSSFTLQTTLPKGTLNTTFAESLKDNNTTEKNYNFAVEYPVNDTLKMTLGVGNRIGGPKGTQRTRQFSLNGLLAKRIGPVEELTVASSVNSNKLMGSETTSNKSLKMQGRFLGGTITVNRSEQLNEKTLIYYPSRVFRFDSDSDSKRWYRLAYFQEDMKEPSGKVARKVSTALDLQLAKDLSFTMSNYVGKDAKDGVVLPVAGSSMKLQNMMSLNKTVYVDYSTDYNKSPARSAGTTGGGVRGVYNNKTSYDFYYGYTRLAEDEAIEYRDVFRAKFDYKLNAERFLVFTAQKKSGVDRSTINPEEGETSLQLDFKTLFN